MSGMRQDVDEYLQSYPAARRNFQDLCESNRTRVFGTATECVKFFKSMPIKFGKKYKKALDLFSKNRLYVEKIMRQQNLDALLLPISVVGVATYDGNQVNTWKAAIASNAGLPAMTINVGYDHNMPVGVELIGKQFAEGTLIEIAYAYEKKLPLKINPQMPEPNTTLEKWDIPVYNNLITRIGYRSYMEILEKTQSNQNSKILMPDTFKTLVNEEINK